MITKININKEMLSRGKSTKTKEWVEGYYCGVTCETPFVDAKESSQIILLNCFWVEVDPATVGRFTGLTDKHEIRIYEGDIVKAYWHNEREFTEKITFRNGCFWFGNWNFIEFLDKFRNYEIVGNIYDTEV